MSPTNTIRRVRAGAAAAALLLLWGCGDATAPAVPTSLVLSLSTVTLDAVGATQAITVTVKDQHGQPMPDAPVAWRSSALAATVTPSASPTAPQGATIVAAANGTAIVTASAGAATSSASVVVTQAPASLARISGDAQSGTVNAALPAPIVLRVLDRLGAAIADQPVAIAITSGGGSAPTSTVRTSADGMASIVWTLGTIASQTQQLTATLGALPPVSFTATARAGSPASLAPVGEAGEGTSQSATVGSPLAHAPAVHVSDSFGNAVQGVAVGFAVSAGGGSIGAASATTDEQGNAAAGVWTLGRTPGMNTISITVPGLSALTIAATAVAGAPESLVVIGGDSQSGAAGSVLPIAPSVRVSDRYGNPLRGVVVVFAASGGGALAAASATTSADGAATPGTWTLGTTVGTNTLTVTVPGVPPSTISATVVAGAAAGLTLAGGNGQSAPAGTPVAVAPSVKVHDAYGNPVRASQVTFTASGGGGSVTGAVQSSGADGIATAGGWTLGTTAGVNTLTALATGAPPLTFTATGTTASSVGTISAATGQNVAGMAGQPVLISPSVLVSTPGGGPLAGVGVTFSVSSGGGTITGATATTDASGRATVGSWTLGTIANGNTLTARVSTPSVGGGPIVFSASGCEGGGGSGFAVTVCYRGTMTPAQRAAFANAAAKWSTVIAGDEPDVSVNIPAGSCDAGSPALNLEVDDVLIFASIEPIDGVGHVLGQAGPCYMRASGGLPVIGTMFFDEADVASMEGNATLTPVILHEMGHVLGIGTLWGSDLLRNPSTAGTTLDTYFAGAGAAAAFNSVGGATYTGGMKVPVENTGGVGTMNAHWRETVLANELMTGYIGAGTNPLSAVTVRSLEDIGYVVNAGAADPFFRTLSLRAPGDSPAAVMEGDIFVTPRRTIEPDGRVSPAP